MICHEKTYHNSFYANVPLQCAISGSIEMEHWCKTATVSLKLVLISKQTDPLFLNLFHRFPSKIVRFQGLSFKK